MHIKTIIPADVLLCLLSSCTSKQWFITESQSAKIAIDSKTEQLADTAYINFLQPLKQKLDAEMNIVIGRAAETMQGHGPESLLSNFSADVYRSKASEIQGEAVDIAIVNLGGLRTQVPAGDITVRKVFELMPFENELVILWLRGDKLNELLQNFAKMGGQGVAGLRMTISERKAVDITIGGLPLDMSKTYTIATNDYLAGGNDNMEQLAEHEKRLNTGVKVRNMLLDFIKSETQKGNMIQSKLDGRIKINE